MLNTLSCVTGGAGNTGVGSCYLDPKNIVGAILLPKGTSFAAADTVDAPTLLAALQALSIAALPANRAYPIADFQQITDNSEDVTIQTLGYGGKAVTREGDTDWSFQFIKGGLCLNKALRKFNGQTPDVMFYDAAGVLYGYKVGTAFRGIPLSLMYTAPLKINDGTNTSIYLVRFVFKPTYLNDSPGFVEGGDTQWGDVVGLQDVAVTATKVTAVITAKGKVGCAATDLYDLYATELAVVAAHIVKNAATGNLITVASVAVDANAKAWTVTLDTADPDYTASATGVTYQLANPTVLAGLNVDGLESNVVTTTAP